MVWIDGGPAGPRLCSPLWHAAEQEARAWARRWRLVGDAAEVRRLASMGQGRMAGYLAPAASPGELGLLACWGVFIALVDDGFDREAGDGSPATVRAVLDSLVAVVSGDRAGAAGEAPAVAALKDLWARTTVGTTAAWQSRFAAAYTDFAEATCQEMRWREQAYVPSVREYVRLRRRTITVVPLLLVAERLLNPWPEGEALHAICADVVAWTNDLADAGSQRPGQLGLVDVLARERKVDRGQAAVTARAMLEERLDDFDAAAAQLRTTAGPGSADTGARIARVRTFLDGAVTWQYESPRYRAGLPRQGVPGGLGRSPDPVEAAAVRLERRLALAVAAGGAVPDRCAGRVLETGLLLALLRARGTHPHERRELVAWLDERRGGADPVDALLIDACLRPQTLPAQAAEAARPVAGELTGFTGGRGRLKRSMLHAVLHVLGGLRLDAGDMPQADAGETVYTFTTINLLAVRVLYAQTTGFPHAVSSGERFRLAALLEDDRGRLLWESNAAAHLLALHALHRCRPTHALFDRAAMGLLLARDRDGALPFLDSQDVWLSAVGGLAFLRRPRLRPYTARMGAFVASWQDADGGWPFAAGVRQTDTDTAARCMEFLQALDPHRYRRQLARGAAYLASMALPGGGFPTWTRGDTPDLDMTAGAVIALAPHARHNPHDAGLVAAATRFVLDHQHRNGTWTPAWTLSEAGVILRAVSALQAAPALSDADQQRITTATMRAAARLTTTQHHDGGWGHTPDHDSDALSTAQALPIAARYCPPHVTATATAYLLSQQDTCGRFPAVPDQTGPRPMAFDFPVVADFHALTALTPIRPHNLRTPARATGPYAGRDRPPARTLAPASRL